MPNPPLLLVDNIFDTVNLYPGGVLTADTEAVGHEVFRISDYRRDRTSWQAAFYIGAQSIIVQLPVAASIDFLFLDRGHNLAGKSISMVGGNDGVTFPVLGINVSTIPSSVGGSPIHPSMCQTEEGACYTLVSAPSTACLYWKLSVPGLPDFMPLLTGVMAGLRTQLLGYSKTFDEDAGGRTQPTTQSTAGYRANDRAYSWRTVSLDLDLVGAPEYDNTIRTLRSRLFDLNQPFVCAMDYGTHPERAWMYTLDATTWAMPKTHVYRAGRITGREHMPVLR